jgi:predicted metalloprotease with PDZ domain
MSDDHTRSVTVKRTAKKKSGYIVSVEDAEYLITATPAKARVNVGDKVVGINGIKAEDFVDEDDANDLIESIRIVVVPEDQIEAYEAAKEDESDDEEEYEEYDRNNKDKEEPEDEDKGKEKGKGKKAAAAAAVAAAAAAAAAGAPDKVSMI